MIPLLILSLVVTTGVAEGHALGQERAAAPSAPVALVSRVRGDVRVQSSSGTRAVRLFDRLHAGDTLQAGDRAEAVVVFRSGARARIGGNTRARVEPSRADRIEGVVETLSPVPTVPLVAPVAGAGTTITAVRIRAGDLKIVWPAAGASTLADATVLRFEPVPSDGYDVEVEAPDATVVFRSRVREAEVTIPAGVLQPGAGYRWQVGARLPSGFEARGGGRFQTLTAADAGARATLRAALAGGDAESLALLAEVDWTLGLWHEAQQGFRAAESAGAIDAIIGQRLSEIARRLAGGAPAPPGNDRH